MVWLFIKMGFQNPYDLDYDPGGSSGTGIAVTNLAMVGIGEDEVAP